MIQAVLGHDKLDTTARYTRVATGRIAAIASPLEQLRGQEKPPKKKAKPRAASASHGPACPGGRGHLPRSRRRLAFRQPRPCQPRPDESNVSHRALPHRGAGRPCARCENEACAHTVISYNSCRNRHCPKCQGAAARDWLAEREAELLPVPYFHVVFTLPAAIADIAYQNKAVIYDILFKASAEATLNDRRRSEASWRQDRHHVGAAQLGLGHDAPSACAHDRAGRRPLRRRPALDRLQAGFLLPVRVLSRLFRRLVLSMLLAAHSEGRLKFFGEHKVLAGAKAFAAFLRPLKRAEWVVYAKRPFAGPEAVLAYLARYTHRVAISNQRLIAADESGVTFTYKDYRLVWPERRKTMTLSPHEFIRRFLMHVLPKGFHRIRHYGLFANGGRADNIAKARALLAATPPKPEETKRAGKAETDALRVPERPCPCCGGRMIVIEVFARGSRLKHPPLTPSPVWTDT